MVMAGIAWGAIWGLYEATIGYLVHAFVHVPGTAAVLLVPFAVLCLHGAARAGGMRAALVATATAASLKLADFVLPVPMPFEVLNPAVAIVLEGLAFLAVARVLGLPARERSTLALALGAVAFSLAWRVGFVVWSLALGRGALPDTFLGRDALLSAAVITMLAAAARTTPAPRPGVRTASLLLLVALATELAGRAL